MRVPFSKAYRAFKELDGFGDTECRRYVAQARRLAVRVPTPFDGVMLGVIIISGLASLVTLGLGTSTVLSYIWRAEESLGSRGVALSAATIVAGALGVVLLRDLRLRYLLRARLRLDSCAVCGTSLLGVPCSNGVMTCPNCGRAFEPGRSGLTPEDLLSFESAADGLRVPMPAPCPICEAQLIERVIERGGVRCHSCGYRVPVAKLPVSKNHFRRRSAIDSLNGGRFPFERRCPACSYSCFGLQVHGGQITCPECAAVADVLGFEYSPGEIMAVLRGAEGAR